MYDFPPSGDIDDQMLIFLPSNLRHKQAKTNKGNHAPEMAQPVTAGAFPVK